MELEKYRPYWTKDYLMGPKEEVTYILNNQGNFKKEKE